MGNVPNKIIVNYIDITDLQRINYFYPKKYRGKVWKSVDIFTFFVFLRRVLAYYWQKQNERNLFLMPNLYIISGCNGAGKTTASLTVLPETLQCKEFVNCDEIAKGLSPLNPDGAKVAAGRLMLSRIKKLINDKEDFAIETTLAAKSYHALINKARQEGYKASLIYFWLQSPDLAIQRVAERVKHGGHHVDDSIIRRRYRAGIKNLFHLYCPVVDYFLFIDNSIMPSEVIAEGNIKSIKFYNEEKFKKIRQYDNSNSECQEE